MASRRTPRDRDATEARILAAVARLIERDGFVALGVNALAREAGIDKVLIYRYFGGLPGVLQVFAADGRLWPTLAELLPDGDERSFRALPLAQRYAAVIDHLIDGLRARPLTLRLLAAEAMDRGALGGVLDEQRAAWGADMRRLLGGKAFTHRHDFHGLTLLVVGGIQYLLVRSVQTRMFEGIDIQSDRGWARLKASVRGAAERLFDGE